MDFTLEIYKKLLTALKQAGYSFITFEEFCEGKQNEKFVILRHDIDKFPKNALIFAKIENELSIKSTYFFLTKKSVFKQDIIRQIYSFNHKIGYHYKDFVDAKGNAERAIILFEKNLSLLRTVVPVKTIAMDGCPTSRHHNHKLWETYNYRNFAIIGEPYFDVDFNEVYYLTDTGRRWNGERFSVRDKVKSNFNLHYKTTNDIINAAISGSLPAKIMITAHPQRWTDKPIAWIKELVLQSFKNILKLMIKKIRWRMQKL